MKQKLSLLLLILLTIALVACGGVAGGEPSADELPVSTPNPDEPVSSDDPQPTSEPETAAEDDVIIGEATVEDVQINIMESFPVQVSVSVSGALGDGCTELGDIQTEREGDTFFVTILTRRPADAICTQQLVFFEENVALDVFGLEAGAYTVDVNGVTKTFTLDVDNALPDEESGLGTDEETTSGAELPQEDLATLIQMTLERALVDQEIPDYTLLTADRDEIILSTENIDPALVPDVAGHTLVLMTPDEIQAKADAEGDFPYLRFQQITAVSETEATVSLGSTMAVAVDSDMIYLVGGGFTIEYTQTDGVWTGEITEAWIS